MAGKEENPDLAAKPTEAEFNYEIGVEYNLPFATPYTEGLSAKARADKELRELLRDEGEEQGPTVAQLIAMRRLDGQARALYRLLSLPIRAALQNATFVPADDGDAEAEFIDLQFNLPPASGGMSVTFQRFMAQLLQALFDGFSPFEQVYDYATYGPLKGKYVLRKLGYRQPDTITIIEDEDGHFAGFRQRAYRNGEVVDVHIPRDRAFYYAAQEEERKYYGVSFFQSAFYHYDKKVKMYYIAHLAAQRSAVGTRVGTIPNSATENQKRVFAQNLSNLAIAQWMMVPENFKVEMLKDSGTFPFLDYINHHNNQMSKSILANFFDKESGGGEGDAKLVSFGQPGDSMFILMLRAIMDDIANSINHYIIPRLIDWNFSGGKYPQFRWAELTDEQKAAISSTFDKLASSETVSPEFTRELEKKMADEMGLEIDWEAVEEREASEKEVQNMMQGIGPDGKPLPLDATGNAILPGQPNPDQDIKDFESQLAGGNSAQQVPPTDPTKKPKVKLSGEAELLDMAQELLSLASMDERTVRTEEGSRRYDRPIGQDIPEGERPEPTKSKVTVERLMSLKAQYDEFKSAGNASEAKRMMTLLRRAIFDYTGDWKTSTFISTLNQISKPKE